MTSNIETMIAQVDALDDQIFKLTQTIADEVNALQLKKSEVNALLNMEIEKAAEEQLSGKDYGCGTANIETTRHKVKVVVRKSVKWDEAELIKIREKIVEAGQNPAVFIKEKLSVSETAYKNFPIEIQNELLPARTVEAGKPSIKIERK